MSRTSTTQTTPTLKPLGIIFDIDGTLVAENHPQYCLRPRTIEFLRWLLDRGHRVALWTAAHESWAETNAYRICQRVHGEHEGCWGEPGFKESPCSKTFSFAWGRSKLRARKQVPIKAQQDMATGVVSSDDVCFWCGPYRHSCSRCYCCYYSWECPCRHVKELRRIWNDKSFVHHKYFSMERSIIVENTPQQCISNYSNAVYVPTFQGHDVQEEKKDEIFDRMKNLILELEQAENVRHVRKCSHPIGPHACFRQNWHQSEPILNERL